VRLTLRVRYRANAAVASERILRRRENPTMPYDRRQYDWYLNGRAVE
jgi:hypothetical protein